jgi:tRNA-specific adenosine deaminase 3
MIHEIYPKRSLTNDEIFRPMVISELDPKVASKALASFSQELPLHNFSMEHLKRIRKRAISDCNNNDKIYENDDDNDELMESDEINSGNFSEELDNNNGEEIIIIGDKKKKVKRQRNSKGIIEVIVCPPDYVKKLPPHLAAYCTDIDKLDNTDNNNNNNNIKSRIVNVSTYLPENKSEFEEWGKIWPINFRPNELDKEREKGHNESDKNKCIKYMNLAKEDSKNCESVYNNLENMKGNFGAIIVNPNNSKIVMTSFISLQHSLKMSGDTIKNHPLLTPTMLCIEGVSAIVRGEIDGKGSLPDNFYVCSGLDLYLTEEPDVMSSMALVHSRIRRVYYNKVSSQHGALETFHQLHSIRSLNHKFRVFRIDDHEIIHNNENNSIKSRINLADVIDMERYPILDISSRISQDVLANCRSQLAEDGSCIIPGFIRSDMIKHMCAEVSNLPNAFVRNKPILAFQNRMHNRKAPQEATENHPYNKLWPQEVHAIAQDGKLYITINSL